MHFTAKIHAIHGRQVEIQKEDRGGSHPHDFQGLFGALRRQHGVTGVGEHFCIGQPDARRVIHNEN